MQVCCKSAISMFEDNEGFRYPSINEQLCVNCQECRKMCLFNNMPEKYSEPQTAFGGYHINADIRFESTSGGAFSAIVDAFCDDNYVIFGARAKGLFVFHDYITDKSKLSLFRKSKYSQSVIGNAYAHTKRFLAEGKKVLFSGTPCQIAGLKTFLKGVNEENLLTIEVVCEGVPSPNYMRKYEKALERKYGAKIESIDYRYTGKSFFNHGKWDFEAEHTVISDETPQTLTVTENRGGGKWDFQVMRITLAEMKKIIVKDRWFNPFWSIWLKHLMSRPSCYECPFATKERVADITVGDLWGVHIYCPELYGKNGGASLVICNSEKGRKVFEKAKENMFGHELDFDTAIKYQSPMRKTIDVNINREEFMRDLAGEMSYTELNKKWAQKPTVKLLFQKYIWGNRQKIWLWNLLHRKIVRKSW